MRESGVAVALVGREKEVVLVVVLLFLSVIIESSLPLRRQQGPYDEEGLKFEFDKSMAGLSKRRLTLLGGKSLLAEMEILVHRQIVSSRILVLLDLSLLVSMARSILERRRVRRGGKRLRLSSGSDAQRRKPRFAGLGVSWLRALSLTTDTSPSASIARSCH